jgi:hypothetical protein
MVKIMPKNITLAKSVSTKSDRLSRTDAFINERKPHVKDVFTGKGRKKGIAN